jgi:cytochrome P450
LWEEVRDVLADGPLTYERVAELVYTDRVLTETLRMYPPGWLLTREVTVDTDLGGHDLAAGSCLVFSPYVMHHNADLFPQPETFDPDRELDPVPGAFVAWGGGPRRCIGERFAMLSAVIILATLIARWRVELVTGARYRPDRSTSLHPRHLRLRVFAREAPDRVA